MVNYSGGETECVLAMLAASGMPPYTSTFYCTGSELLAKNDS